MSDNAAHVGYFTKEMTNTSGDSLTAPKVLKWLGCDK